MFNSPETELTTAATDALLGAVCLVLAASLTELRAHDPWRAWLWVAVFVLIAFASLVGAVVHGFTLRPGLRASLWQPLYLALAVAVALFVVGAVGDWLGEAVARRLVLPAAAVGALFWLTNRRFGGRFLGFVMYEGIAMAASLAVYGSLAYGDRLPGAGTIAGAIVLNGLAAGIQASSLRVRIVWPFDHNGLFHLVQIAGALLLHHGIRLGLLGSASAHVL